MKYMNDEQRKALAGNACGFVPPPPRIGDVWLHVLDQLVQLATLGRGRVVRNRGPEAPMHWDGIIR